LASIISKISRYVLAIVSIAAVLYQLASTQRVFVDPYQHQTIHLVLVLTLMFLLAIRTKPRFWPIWIGLLTLSIFCTGYMFVFTEELQFRVGLPNILDMFVGGVLVVVTLVALHEASGKIIPIFISFFIAYTFFGQYLPMPFHHPDLPLDRIISLMSVGFSGLYGKLLEISAAYLFLFLVFAGLLSATGASQFFTEIGKLAGRKLAGGPAMTSVVASCLFGSVSGSPDANVIVTGSFTIPLMKKVGFKPEQAGGIEAAASTGGLVMPPIMAATAFIMASFIGITYKEVMIMAFPPAILYYFGCGLYVLFQAKKMSLAPWMEEINKRVILTSAPSFLIPMGIIVILLVMGYSPQYSVFWGIMSSFAIYFARMRTLASVGRLIDALTEGATNGARVGITVAALGIAMSTMTMTGLGIKLPMAIEMWAGGNVLVAVLATMVVIVILGCGLPILPSYIIVALTVAPALIRMGIPPVQTHFFIFYFAAFSMVTPPVAVSSLVASRLANADYAKTSLEAIKVSAVAYLVPFLFIWSPAILLQPTEPLYAIISILAIIMAIIAISSAFVGCYFTTLNWKERILLGLDGAVLFIIACTKGVVSFAVATSIFGLMTLWQWNNKKTQIGLSSAD
jgi:TRAP transporter 4TM/12TM fusion protein